jgi:pyruvate/2-oxoglutarate dehydrogenase complex dihydrolipoamide dehydrogenase (E3) component
LQKLEALKFGMSNEATMLPLPLDEANRSLLERVRPARWVNPEPKSRYHLVVIGAGTAGLVSAAGAAGLGAKVALIERQFMGGDCLNFGCVPSKALLRAARAVADVRAARQFGIEVGGEVRVDFPAIMTRMRRLRADMSPNDSAQRFRDLGVDVFFGDARLSGPDAVTVAGKTLHFRRAIIATGTRPTIPAIPGLADAACLTNETIFSLAALPARMAVIGAGPIGCELAQAFARFGSRVTLIGNHEQILPREDADAAAIVAEQLARDGVELRLSSQVTRVDGGTVAIQNQGQTQIVEADAILLAAGRTPNLQELCLAEAGVSFDARDGVLVNDRLQTSNGRIFAAGDVCSRFKFTHAADAYARIAVQNALFYGRAKASALVIPWCTYTDPEIAHVGLNENDARSRGVAIQTFVQEFRHVDRAILDGDTSGFAKIHVRAGTDQIAGATIVGRHAGDMIGTVTLAMTGKLGLKTLAKTIQPYPTHSEAVKKLGDTYNKTRLTPTVRWLFEKWFRWIT